MSALPSPSRARWRIAILPEGRSWHWHIADAHGLPFADGALLYTSEGATRNALMLFLLALAKGDFEA